MRNFEDITSPKHLQKLDSVVSPSLQDPTSTKVITTISTPIEHPSILTRATPAVVSPSTQGHPSLYDCENTLQQVATSFIEADALHTSKPQVSSSLDFVKHSCLVYPVQTAGSIKKKRRAVVTMPILAFEMSTDSPFRNNTTLKDPAASSALTAADSQDNSLLDVEAIIALAGTLCDPTSSSSRASSHVAQSSTLQVNLTPLKRPEIQLLKPLHLKSDYLPIEDNLAPSNPPEATLLSFPQSSNSVDFDHLQQYHEESTLAQLQHSGQNSPQSTHIGASLEREEDEEPSFYNDILAAPSLPFHHERIFPDNPQVILQDLMYETPTTEPERKKRCLFLWWISDRDSK